LAQSRRGDAGKPVVPKGTKFWSSNGGPYDYPHSGFAWCWVREVLDKIGGLFELGGMGSRDHHMALGLAGLAEYSRSMISILSACRPTMRSRAAIFASYS
jgi:hypothetical protein